MARYTGPKWRKSRRYGADLWGNPKSMRRGYPPGPRPLRRRKISDRGQQLIEKQKVRYAYGLMEKQFRKVYELVFENRVMGPFLDAVPGLHDAVQLGKIFDLFRETTRWGRAAWDTIVVDAPATGHGLALLDAAHAWRRGHGREGELLGRPPG